MHAFIDVLPDLRSLKMADHEAIAALESAIPVSGSRSSSKRIYDLLSGDKVVAQAIFSKGGALKSLSTQPELWRKAKIAIVEDTRHVTWRIARSVLLTYRTLKGSYRVPDWIQIRPVNLDLLDHTGHRILSLPVPSAVPIPFAIEVAYHWSNLGFLEVHRRLTAIRHASWLLATFIDIPIFSLTTSYTWAFIDSVYALVQCGISHGLDNVPEDAYSDISNIPILQPVPLADYFTSLGIGSTDFRIPDLAELHARFANLPSSEALRFLRCCASIHTASDPSTGLPQRLVGLVSAIEPLLQEAAQCKHCHSHVGITKEFSAFLDKFVQPILEVRHVYENIYAHRSKIVHGSWNPDVDEPLFSLLNTSDDISMAAWAAAKRGAVNWLLAQ